MRRNAVCAVVLLTLVWIALNESLSVATIMAGVGMSVLCLVVGRFFLPFEKIKDIDFLKFMLYPIYLIGQVYLAGFEVMKLVVTGGKVEIVEVRTELGHDFLKVMLMQSITLTPGTIPLAVDGDKIKVLWFHKKNEVVDDMDERIKGALERKLQKMKRRA